MAKPTDLSMFQTVAKGFRDTKGRDLFTPLLCRFWKLFERGEIRKRGGGTAAKGWSGAKINGDSPFSLCCVKAGAETSGSSKPDPHVWRNKTVYFDMLGHNLHSLTFFFFPAFLSESETPVRAAR